MRSRLMILFLVLGLTPQAAWADEAAVQRFRAEAPAGWTKLKAGIQQGVSFKKTTRYRGSSEPPFVWSHRLMGLNEFAMDYRANGVERIDAINEDYGFALWRENAKKPWTLLNLTRDPATQKKPYGVLPFSLYAFAGCTVRSDWAENLIQGKQFSLKSVEAETSSIYRAEFVSNHKLDDKNFILGGTLWMDASRFWTLIRYEIKLQSWELTGTARYVLEYQDLGGFPFPKRQVETYLFPPPDDGEIVTDYTDVSRTPNQADFRLSAFGLPEPILTQPKRWGWLWINVGAVIVLVLAWCLRRYVNRTPVTEKVTA